MRPAALFLLAAAALQAAVDGTVVNGATGRPQPGVRVALVVMGGAGEQPRASAISDQAGRFAFAGALQGAALVQATHQGVTYNLMVQPGAPSTGLTLEVFDSSARPGAAKVTEDVVVLEPAGAGLSVRETVIWRNTGKETFHDTSAGTLRFYAPPEARDTVRVSATAPGSLPATQAPEPAGPPGIYKVAFPIRPGETVFEISYTLPFSSPGRFSGRAVQKDAPVRLAVPAGVTLKGDGVELLGQEPESRASIYGVGAQDYSVEIEGSGTMAAAGGVTGEGGGSGLSQILPRVYDSAYAIVGLAFAILALGFILLYRKRPPASASTRPSASPRGRNPK